MKIFQIIKSRFSRTGKRNKDTYRPGNVTGLKSSSSKSRSKRRKSILSGKSIALKLFLLPFLIVTVIIVLVLVAQLVLKIREKPTFNTSQKGENMVVGFENVPEYQFSEFVFNNKDDDSTVQEFIGKGYSIYRILTPKDFDDVKEFYKNTLTEYGWEFVQEVAVESEEQKYGLYWQKQSEGLGLRVFSQINDIWYQRITDEGARTGLKDQVLYENEIAQIIENAKRVSLLPNYPWKLQLEKDILVNYYAIENEDQKISDILAVQFKYQGDSGKVLLYPALIYKGGVINDYRDDIEALKGYEFISKSVETRRIGSVIISPVRKVDTENLEVQENLEPQLKDENDNLEQTEQIEDELPNQVAITIHFPKKIVFIMEKYGESDQTNYLFEYLLDNLSSE